MLDYITHLVLAHQHHGKYRDILHREIHSLIYDYPRRNYCLPEEEWCEFMLSLQTRIDSLISGFEFRGYSFVAYLNRTLSWQVKSYWGSRKNRLNREWIMERESALGYEEIQEEPRELCSLKQKVLQLVLLKGDTPNRRRVLRLRLLILLLKNIQFLEEQEFLDCAADLRFDPREASLWRVTLLNCIQERMGRRNLLIERRNHLYHKITYYQKKRMELFCEYERALLDERIARFRKRHGRINEELSRVCLVPSNREISSLLNIPKGSVDSGLFYLKEMMMQISRDAEEPADLSG